MNSVAKFFFILLMIFCLVVFVMNKSISSYLEQKYHVYFYPQNDMLSEANALKIKLEQIKSVLINDSFASSYEQAELDEPLNEQDLNPEPLDTNASDVNLSLSQPLESQVNNQILTLDDNSSEFLFIGDSLMQGVALALKRDLRQKGFLSIDLSKQNTGLSYKSYFDWARATQIALDNNPKIKYLVVLLGANDPWNIKNFRFNSEGWREIYIARINELIQIAQNKGVRVLWYEIPPVKKEDLNAKVQILNSIYRAQIYANNEIFIDTNASMSLNGAYSSYIKNDQNESIKVRADDGIHFTYSGSKLMSRLLLEHLRFDF